MKKKSFEKLIPDDVIKIIFEYVGCLEFTKLNLINKEFNKIYKSLPKKCKILRYENLTSCSKHINGYSHIIEVLNRFHSGIKSSIHFNTIEDMEIAKPYIFELGTISHFCCGGKGVMFINNESIINVEENEINLNINEDFPNLVNQLVNF